MGKKMIMAAAALVFSMLQLASCAQAKSQKTTNNENDQPTTTAGNQDNQQTKVEMNNKKILVAFFSRAGENYGVGNVKEGNTKVLAGMIAEVTGGELFEIAPVKAYPADYTRCTEVAKDEKDSNARPDITADKDVENYDIIFLGYPNWWSDAPMPVYTFIDKHAWEGKIVIPFCTHEGSGLNNVAEITAACKGATILKGLGMRGNKAQNSRDAAKKEVEQWIKGLGL